MTEGLIGALATVWAGYALGTLIPGPNVICVTTSALLGGRSQGVGAAAGVAIATLAWSLAGVMGLGALLDARPDLVPVMEIAGGLALAGLGLSTLRDRAGVARDDAGRGLLRGLLAALANPINAILWTALATFVLRIEPTPAEIALYVASCGVLAFAIHGSLAVVVAGLPARPSPRPGGTARALCGGAFLFAGGMLVGG